VRKLSEFAKELLESKSGAICGVCGAWHQRKNEARAQSKCEKCHAAYMAEWRKTHPLEGDSLKKARTRSYTKMLVKRGTIKRAPCQKCGEVNSEVHHPDYSNPRLVEWLCRPCHLELHRLQDAASQQSEAA
jgi:hypothetical protein